MGAKSDTLRKELDRRAQYFSGGQIVGFFINAICKSLIQYSSPYRILKNLFPNAIVIPNPIYPTTSWDYAQQFFTNVASSFQTVKDHITIELMSGDLLSLSDRILDDTSQKRANLPRQFKRIYAGDTLDQNGGFLSLFHLMRMLDEHDASSFVSSMSAISYIKQKMTFCSSDHERYHQIFVVARVCFQ